MDGSDDCEYAGDGVLGTGDREIGRGDSEGMRNLTCFLGLVCSTREETGLVCLAIAGRMRMSELVGMLSEGTNWGLARLDLYLCERGSVRRHRMR